MSPVLAVRPEGANHQWRRNPPGELSIDPVADERLMRVTAWDGRGRGDRLSGPEPSPGPISRGPLAALTFTPATPTRASIGKPRRNRPRPLRCPRSSVGSPAPPLRPWSAPEALTDSTPRDRQRRTRHAINYHALTGKTMELYLNGAHTLIGAPARLPTPQTLEGAPASVAFAVPISTATNSAQATQGSVSAQRRVSCTISPQL